MKGRVIVGLEGKKNDCLSRIRLSFRFGQTKVL